MHHRGITRTPLNRVRRHDKSFQHRMVKPFTPFSMAAGRRIRLTGLLRNPCICRGFYLRMREACITGASRPCVERAAIAGGPSRNPCTHGEFGSAIVDEASPQKGDRLQRKALKPSDRRQGPRALVATAATRLRSRRAGPPHEATGGDERVQRQVVAGGSCGPRAGRARFTATLFHRPVARRPPTSREGDVEAGQSPRSRGIVSR